MNEEDHVVTLIMVEKVEEDFLEKIKGKVEQMEMKLGPKGVTETNQEGNMTIEMLEIHKSPMNLLVRNHGHDQDLQLDLIMIHLEAGWD